MMSMIELDPPGFQPPRPMAGDEGSRRTVLYGGYTVFSVFQPVFSVSHRRAIGYHASLRAHDEHAQQVPSHEVFTQAARRGDLLELGRLAESLHLGNFNAFDSHDEWLFLSLHPAALMDTSYGDALLAGLKALGLPPQRVVLEVSEQAGGETTRFAEIIDALRKSGFLIALDGFGAKHSNIDRVWNLRPDIVTLDRCILAQASEHSHIERVLPGLVSLLHESGQLVLMGGLSTERDALIALECNVDFVQGAFFAGPSVEPVKPQAAAGLMDSLSAALRERVATRERAQATRLAPYVKALDTFNFYTHYLVWPETLKVSAEDLTLRTDELIHFLSSISSTSPATLTTWFAQLHSLAQLTESTNNSLRKDIGLSPTTAYPT